MLKHYATAGIMATFCSAALIAQTPTTGASPQTPPAQPGAAAPATGQRTTTVSQQGASVTLVGCLQREENVQGRQPNVAERAGLMEDYILTGAQMASAASSAGGASAAAGTSGTTAGTSGTTAGTSGTTASSGAAGTSGTTASSGASGSQPGSSASGATVGTSGTTASGAAASGSAANISSKYKVEGIADERLQQLVGKRVEVSGRVDADDAREVAGSGATGTSGASAQPATPQRADDDMPEFEAVSIREVPGACDEGR